MARFFFLFRSQLKCLSDHLTPPDIFYLIACFIFCITYCSLRRSYLLLNLCVFYLSFSGKHNVSWSEKLSAIFPPHCYMLCTRICHLHSRRLNNIRCKNKWINTYLRCLKLPYPSSLFSEYLIHNLFYLFRVLTDLKIRWVCD